MLKIISEVDNRELSFKSWIFNSGEVGFSLDKETIYDIHSNWYCKVIARLQSSNDLIELCSCIDSINRIVKDTVELKVPYILGGRQDRVPNKGECFSLKLYCDILNSLNCDIEIVDPHSDVTLALLKRSTLYPIENIIKKVIDDCEPDCIIIPDVGATKRVEKYMATIGCNLPQIQCLKKRDTLSGKLSGFRVCLEDKRDLKDKTCLIIDDIGENCGTFLGLAEVLKESNVNLNLYITHAILPKGMENLNNLHKYFDKVYCTDSFNNNLSASDRFIVYPLY